MTKAKDAPRQNLPQAARGRDGRPIGSRCTDACKRPTQTQAHCSVCHQTFGGVYGFDMHRYDGWCAEPAGLGMTLTDGIWRREVGPTGRFPVAGKTADDPTPVSGGSGGNHA